MANLIGSTSKASTPGVLGENTNNTSAAGVGVHGKSDAAGVVGESKKWHGVEGHSWSTIGGQGVYGKGHLGNCGVFGESKEGIGVNGKSESTTGGAGVRGEAVGPGVIGTSETWMGVYGETQSTTGGAGVWGEHKANGTGTVGKSVGGVGVWGVSETHEGMHAETKSTETAAMATYQMNAASGSAAFFAKHMGNRTAGRFEGDVEVTGDIRLTNADCAEDFDIVDACLEPGTVMVVGEEGTLHKSYQPYDRRVAGVISGAGDYKPGIVLDKQHSKTNRKPIALLGKVYCKVDASYASIEVGDLLTTAPTPGHAMKAIDPLKAFGSVIGKALRPLKEGQGLIPILIALQ